jgi:hypothetical protein
MGMRFQKKGLAVDRCSRLTMLSRCGRDRHTKIRYRWNFIGRLNLLAVQYKEVEAMTKILLATVAIVAFAAPSFAQQEKTTGQAPPSGASSFYLAQDTTTMKCQIVNARPAAGGHMKLSGCLIGHRQKRKQLWRRIGLAPINEVKARVQRWVYDRQNDWPAPPAGACDKREAFAQGSGSDDGGRRISTSARGSNPFLLCAQTE